MFLIFQEAAKALLYQYLEKLKVLFVVLFCLWKYAEKMIMLKDTKWVYNGGLGKNRGIT
jgi:hypothetical protein